MNVVTSAMITSIANSASEMTPFSSARFSTISSVRPRVFISVPITNDARQSKPVIRAAIVGAEQLADDRDDDQHERDQPQHRPVEQTDVRSQAGVGEEQRQQDDDDEVLDPVRDVLGQPRVARHDHAHDERAEDHARCRSPR